MTKPVIIGLFSGAGGIEVGAELAAGNIRLAVELDATACTTLRANANYPVHEADV